MVFMKYIRSVVILLLSVTYFLLNTASAVENNVKKAVDVIETLCLSGTEYALDADASGNIVVKHLKGEGRVSFNVRESGGATALQNDLRIIGDQDVRECTQTHIGRVLDAIFEVTPVFDAQNSGKEYNTIENAKFGGYLPGKIEFYGHAEGEKQSYFRFQVKTPTTFSILTEKNTKMLALKVLTRSSKTVANHRTMEKGSVIKDIFLVPGDYYLGITTYSKSEATSFLIKMTGK
jgi:hypothetical protein